MNPAFAKVIAQSLGVLVVCAFAFVAWYFEFRMREWPPWFIAGLVIVAASIVVYVAIRVTKRLR